MFEGLADRVARLAHQRAAVRRRALCARLAESLPAAIRAEEVPAGVRLSGPALRRRLARDRALAWLIAGVLK